MKTFAIHKDVETQERLNIAPQPKVEAPVEKEAKQTKKKVKDEEAGEEANKA